MEHIIHTNAITDSVDEKEIQSEEQVKNHNSKVIIAINTTHNVGYFVDSEGHQLFNKKFEGVQSFSEGLARICKNEKISLNSC